MKKIGFIGGYDKTDLIIYIAKLLEECGQSVLIIDTTAAQRARYTVPCIAPSKYYVTTYEEIDIAIGFESLETVKDYLGDMELNYTTVLIDIDSAYNFTNFQMQDAEKNYFVTAFDSYSLKRGMEVFSNLSERTTVKKVYVVDDFSDDDDEYINFMALTYKVDWDESIIFIPYNLMDMKTIIDNQKATKVHYKYLTNEYKDALLKITHEIAPEIKSGDIKRILKNV